MAGTIYLTAEDVTELHDMVMERMGCPNSPLLHLDKLDSATNRPCQLVNYEPGADLIAQATRLAIAISQAQAFEDGNKRAAFAATDTFLALNGISFEGDRVTFGCWLICVAGNINDDDLDMVAERLGLDLAAELDAARWETVSEQFEAWLRLNVSYCDEDGSVEEER